MMRSSPGYERGRALASHLNDTVVDFARNKTQRQADHARGVPQHAISIA
jgi:hypothetical protein